jgi:hypothetical protein
MANLINLLFKKKKLDASALLELFGHSIYNPDLDKAFKEFSISVPDKSDMKRYHSIKSDLSGITFTFWHKKFYQSAIGIPKSIFKKDEEEEVILYEMTFMVGKNGNYLLPYEMNFGDSSEVVISKLGQKPSSKSKNEDGQITWIFYNNYFKIMPVFDHASTLIWLRVWSIGINDKKSVEFQKQLKLQNKNINPDKIGELISLKDSSPVIKWNIRMKEGDNVFTKNNLQSSSNILNNFIDELIIAAKSKKATSVYSKAKRVIEDFNKLNHNSNGFIETIERDELVDFIEKAIKLTGFLIEEGVDITEDWREW